MRKGYIGQRTRRRKRYINLFLFFILLIGATIYFVYSSGNTDEEIIKIERINIEKERMLENRTLFSMAKEFANSVTKGEKIAVPEEIEGGANNREAVGF